MKIIVQTFILGGVDGFQKLSIPRLICACLSRRGGWISKPRVMNISTIETSDDLK